MRKYVTIVAAIALLTTKTFTQSVGINNNSPHASAALDVTSTTKGVLIPRLTQAQRLAIAGPAKGLLVYDSSSNSFWYNNGSVWQELGAATNAWKLNGNAGTDPATQFLGTSDGQPLRFRINNEWAGELNPSFLNVSLGSGAGQPATTGVYNVGMGVNTLHSNITGSSNSANGSNALYTNTTGSSNTAGGSSTLYSNTTGNSNTANGLAALYANTTGYSNVAIGVYALRNNTTRSNLVAIGDSALYNNGTGVSESDDATRNTAVGSKALYANTTGLRNTATGGHALYSNTTGDYNTANGEGALYPNTTGSYNTAIGEGALPFNTTGSYNTANGYQSLYSNSSGNNNTALGYFADVGLGNLINAMALGANASVNASNTVQIGNASVTDVYFGNPAITVLHAASVTPSDARFKYNIKNDIPGLSFIMQLKPVTYNFNAEKLNHFVATGKMETSNISAASYNSNIQTHSGFLAQEVEKAAGTVGYDFDGLLTPAKNPEKYYSLSYSQFVVPLVKAVQEQQQMIEQLQKEITLLKAIVNKK